MSIKLTQEPGKVPVTVIAIQGDLDASNYLSVIEEAKEAWKGGARDFLIDMRQMRFMSSSGLVALHSIALLVRGEELPDTEHGWSAFHAIERDRDSGKQKHIKLLGPQEKVVKTLDMSGLSELFSIYADKGEALASFE